MSTLTNNHAIKSLLESRYIENTNSHCLLLENMTPKQQLKIKSSIVDTNNCLNGIFPVFDSLNSEFSPGSQLVDTFSSCFSFHQTNHRNKESKAAHICKLDECVLNTFSDSKSVIIVSDASIKNNVATSVVHIHSLLNPIKEMVHHAVSITFTEAELFTIRCGINQAIQVPGVSHIIIIMDTIHAAY